MFDLIVCTGLTTTCSIIWQNPMGRWRPVQEKGRQSLQMDIKHGTFVVLHFWTGKKMFAFARQLWRRRDWRYGRGGWRGLRLWLLFCKLLSEGSSQSSPAWTSWRGLWNEQNLKLRKDRRETALLHFQKFILCLDHLQHKDLYKPMASVSCSWAVSLCEARRSFENCDLSALLVMFASGPIDPINTINSFNTSWGVGSYVWLWEQKEQHFHWSVCQSRSSFWPFIPPIFLKVFGDSEDRQEYQDISLITLPCCIRACNIGNEISMFSGLSSKGKQQKSSFFQDFDWTSLAGRTERESKSTVALIIGSKRSWMWSICEFLVIQRLDFFCEVILVMNSWGFSNLVKKAGTRAGVLECLGLWVIDSFFIYYIER